MTFVSVVVSSTLKIVFNWQIASFVSVPNDKNGVGGCGFLNTLTKSSIITASLSVDDFSGICVCLG